MSATDSHALLVAEIARLRGLLKEGRNLLCSVAGANYYNAYGDDGELDDIHPALHARAVSLAARIDDALGTGKDGE